MNFITGVSKTVQLIVRGSDIINEIDDIIESREIGALQAASLATRTTLLFLGIADISFGLSGQSFSKAARGTKAAECIVKLADVPIQTLEFLDILCDDNKDLITKIRSFEKKILGSFIGFARSRSEADLKQQQHYLSLPKEEQDKIQIPVWKYDPYTESYTIEGYRPFNLQECQKTIDTLEKAIPKLCVAETVAEAAVGSKVIGISMKMFDLLKTRTASRIAANQSGAVQPAVVALAPQGEAQAGEVDYCDLSRFNYILPELEEDPTLSQFICPITHRPIRNIVSDPTSAHHTYYERSAIESWLRVRPASPITQLPLTPSMLRPCTAIQAKINERLASYSEKIKDAIREMGAQPVDQGALDAAIQADRG